ncbi:unnamed protein product [Blepharisma stoltei]|uniref:EGF-like domain-containing protein n=1 Tax=Blepharisma stoltei TaxID=1481888 RepID=A0AAU9K5C7_9CILI|nr:unnamed protein product [Blepharisma stoltei]
MLQLLAISVFFFAFRSKATFSEETQDNSQNNEDLLHSVVKTLLTNGPISNITQSEELFYNTPRELLGSCGQGLYNASGTCNHCGALCLSCADATGICNACNDPFKMTLNQTDNSLSCQCIGNQILNQTNCTCPESTFFNGTFCDHCNQTCGDCNNPHNCTKCRDPIMVLTVKGDCVCPSNAFMNSTFQCQLCPNGTVFNGTECTPCNKCDECIDPKMNKTQDGFCVCPENTFLSPEGHCERCGELCHSCIDATHCLECVGGSILNSTANSTVCHCPDQTFSNGTDCAPCKNCTGCSDPMMVLTLDGSCICPNGTFLNAAGHCDKCGPLCDSCTSPNHCLHCAGNSTLSQNSTSAVCLCPNGTYNDGFNCWSCDGFCGHCSDDITCLNCSHPHMFVNEFNVCQCLEGFFWNETDCQPCGRNCKSCTNATTCNECMDKSMDILSDHPGSCSCGLSTYDNGTDCIHCGHLCGNCTNTTVCLSCIDPDTMSFNQSNPGSCMCNSSMADNGTSCEFCPAGTYLINNTCKICQDNSCEVCSGSETSQCTKCFSTHILKNNVCTQCPVGNFSSDGTTCISCEDAGCKVCNGTGTGQCLQCTEPHKFILNGTCQDCPDNSFPNLDGKTCGRCNDTDCKTCHDGRPGQCTECLTLNNSIVNGTCHPCAPGFFSNENGFNCTKCQDTNCTACEGAGSNTCMLCNNPYFLDQKNCTLCPKGQYSDGLQCHTCEDTNCTKCAGNGTETCLECEVNLFLVKGTCQTCAPGNYSADGKCTPCGLGCDLCDNKSVCHDCSDPVLMINNGNGTCSCIKGYFMDALGHCKPCPGLCTSCSSNSTCDSCVPTANLTANGTCACSDGSGVQGNSTCSQCPNLCAKCSDSNTCISCIKNSQLNANNQCVCSQGFSQLGNVCAAACNNLCTNCDHNNGNSCTSCIANAELLKNTCSCTAHSVYDSTSNSCKCNDGFTLVSSKCVLCKNYFASSDIVDGYFNDLFTKITVVFASAIDTSLDSSCSLTVNATSLPKLGRNPQCSWDGNFNLVISLGDRYTLRNETLFLDGTYIVKKFGTCSYNYNPLRIPVKLAANPNPAAIITGPQFFSLACGARDLMYSGDRSTGSLNNQMNYTWSAISSPSIAALTKYVSMQSTSSITIPRSYFSSSTNTTLNVTMTISNIYNLTNSSSIVTFVTSTPSLSVNIDIGNSDSMKSSDSRVYTASVNSLCDNSTSSISWSWVYNPANGAPTIDSSSILSKAKQPNKLVIEKNMLPSGYSYSFTAIAASTNAQGQAITGNSTILVSTSASNLIVTLSRPGGSIPPNQDLVINGDKSFDPDDKNSALNFTWSCKYTLNSTSCLGKDNNVLVSGQTTSSLQIPAQRLIPGASYDLTLLVSKGARNASATITVEVLNANTDTSVSISMSSTKITARYQFTADANIQANSSSTLEWSCANPPLTISPNNLSKLTIPANTLTSGQTYQFQLKITDPAGVPYTVYYPVEVNQGASCTDSLSISPSTGTALVTSFTMSISGCTDLDGEDLPLMYAYNLNQNSINYMLASNQDNSYSTFLMPGSNNVSVTVCDQYDDCSTYYQVIQVDNYTATAGRRLDDSALIDIYSQNTLNSDNIPSMIAIISSATTINSTLFEKMWSDLQSYINSQNSMNNNIFIGVISAIQALATKQSHMNSTLYEQLFTQASQIMTNNSLPVIVDASSILNILVSINDAYLNLAKNLTTSQNSTNTPSSHNLRALKSSSPLSQNSTANATYESYLINSNNFLSNFSVYCTQNDMPGQNSLPNATVSSQTSTYKSRYFAGDLANQTLQYGATNITMPSSLPFNSTDIVNLRVNLYNSTDDYSSVLDISYGKSGNYSDFVYSQYNETYASFNNANHTVNVTIPYNKNATNGWACVYYNETISTWLTNGCQIVSVENGYATLTLSHFSMFKLTDSSTVVVPPISPESLEDSSCGTNLAPVYILVVGLFLALIIWPAPILLDAYSKSKTRGTQKITPLSVSPKGEISQTEEYKSCEEGAKNKMENSTVNFSGIGDSILIDRQQDVDPNGNKPIEFDQDAFKNTLDEKSKWETLIEGHLTAGLFIYKKGHARLWRLFTWEVVIFFELLLEGLLFSGFESTDNGVGKDSQSLFDDYKGTYFGYTVFAVVIAMPIEICLSICLSFDRSAMPKVFYSALALGAMVIMGSIAGVFALSFKFCSEWSGYWAISFLWGILLEVFVMQTIYMGGRYLFLHFFK